MKELRKIVIAGPLWMGIQYAAAHSKDPDKQRAVKSMISGPAREHLNAQASWQKLMIILACNFSPSDLVVHLTYREEDCPKTREDADKKLTAFLRRLRAARKAENQELRYIRVTEGYHSGNRLHHHLIINSTGKDYALISKLWGKYGDNVEYDWFGYDGCSQWSEYLTKEPREQGRRRVGDRTWRASIRLKKPIVFHAYVPESDRLQPPPMASVLKKTECQNGYGHFITITAMTT